MNSKDREQMEKFLHGLEDMALQYGITRKRLSHRKREELQTKIEGFESEFMKHLEETTRMAIDFHETLKLLESDVEAICDGWIFNFVIDYSEIFRFLHPSLDRNRFLNREKFYFSQLVLNYLFNVSKDRLILIPPYLKEFKLHLRAMSSDLEALMETKYETSRQKEVVSLVRSLENGELSDSEKHGVAAKLVHKYALDMLVREKVASDLEQAQNRFFDLVKKRKVCLVEQLGNIDSSFEINRNSGEFRETLIEITTFRPELGEGRSNIIDVEAALWVKKLNAKNFSTKQAFVLVSDSRRIKPVLQKVKASLTKRGYKYESTILRDLYYILFRYYFCDEKTPAKEVLENIRITRKLFKKYLRSIFEIQAKAMELTLEDLDKAKVIPIYEQVLARIWEFEKFMATRIDFKPASLLSDQETIAKIINVVRDENALRDAVQYALEVLKSSIRSLDDIIRQVGNHS